MSDRPAAPVADAPTESESAPAPATPEALEASKEKGGKVSYLFVLKEAVSGFLENNALRLAAAISYTTAFSLAPLLVIVVAVASFVLGGQDAAVQNQIVAQMTELLGASGGDFVRTLIENRRVNPSGGLWATTLGVLTLLFTSTTLFVQVQDALNTIWGVRPKRSAVSGLVRARILSFGMVLMVAFLLLVSLFVSVLITGLISAIPAFGGLSAVLAQVVNFLVPTLLIAPVFAMLFRFLPDARIEWRDVWTGAFVTSILFNVGKVLIGLYLGQSDTASVFGAAGSFAVLLLWVYFSAVLLLFGAEITQAYATHYGSGVTPTKEAVRVVTQEVVVDASQAERVGVDAKKNLAERTAYGLPVAPPKPKRSLARLAAPFLGAFVAGRLTKASRRPKVTIRTGRR